MQISTPYYQKKKEKREQKTAIANKSSENVTETLLDPSLVSVVGVASTESRAVESLENTSKEKQKKKHSTPVKKCTNDAKLQAMDQKWSKHFSCLEAFLLSKSLGKSELTFQTVNIPAKTPPASAVKVTEPFVTPSQLTDLWLQLTRLMLMFNVIDLHL